MGQMGKLYGIQTTDIPPIALSGESKKGPSRLLKFYSEKSKKGVGLMAKKKKTTRIKEEKERLARIFVGLEPNKLSTCAALIDRAAFITVSLEDLEEELNRTGWTEKYQNGESQYGMKK